MNTNVVYILHKNGAESHYLGLAHLLHQENLQLKHREFSIAGKLFKSLIKGKPLLFKKQLINIGFFIQLLFTKNKKIVLGIAPFDHKLGRLLFILKKHQIYYHSSWTCWDKSFQPKPTNKQKVYKNWRYFLEEKVLHVFAVSQQTKTSILENYQLSPSKISVVNHSLHEAFLKNYKQDKELNTFLYVGRLTPEKGIEEILDFFIKNSNLNLTLIGSGKLESKVKEVANKTKNISFYPKITDKGRLATQFNQHQFFLLNSKKTKKWEELFGMVLIEAMAQKSIPIASNHAGPKEIINNKTGYIFTEGDLEETITAAVKIGFSEVMATAAKESAKNYTLEIISKKWKPILI